jgi:hypothetical protein
MDRRAELAAIEQFLQVSLASACPVAYVAPSTAGVSAEEEARRRLRQIVVAASPGISAGKRGNAKKSAEYDRRVAEFFRTAPKNQSFTTAAVCKSILGHNNFTDSTVAVVQRSFRRVAPDGWLMSVRNRRYVFHHSSNPQRGSNG